jgi:hypothetical protein
LDAHAAEEERDLCPPPVEMNDDELNALGDKDARADGRTA